MWNLVYILKFQPCLTRLSSFLSVSWLVLLIFMLTAILRYWKPNQSIFLTCMRHEENLNERADRTVCFYPDSSTAKRTNFASSGRCITCWDLVSWSFFIFYFSLSCCWGSWITGWLWCPVGIYISRCYTQRSQHMMNCIFTLFEPAHMYAVGCDCANIKSDLMRLAISFWWWCGLAGWRKCIAWFCWHYFHHVFVGCFDMCIR